MKLIIKKIFLITCVIGFGSVFAEEQDIELARAMENPLKVNHFAKHISAPIENDTYFGYGHFNDRQNTLNFKPVIPFHITTDYDVIIRTIAPFYEITPTANKRGVIDGHYIQGWGDLNPTFFLSPFYYDKLIWGLGPTISIPTATNNKYIGTGKWSIGPELALTIMPDNWVLGILTNNQWSVAGDPDRRYVNQFSFQYFYTYNFPAGWFISGDPTITANWVKPGNQQWVVPVGIGVGKAFRVHQQMMSTSVRSNYNIVRPSGVGPNWELQLTMEFIYPRS